MIKEEREYLDLVGQEGFDKAVRSLNALFITDVSDSTIKLFYLTLINAYWRGVNKGVSDARDVINAKKAATSDNKPTN